MKIGQVRQNVVNGKAPSNLTHDVDITLSGTISEDEVLTHANIRSGPSVLAEKQWQVNEQVNQSRCCSVFLSSEVIKP